MAALNIASKANQAITLPALLVAEYAREADPNVKIVIEFKDVEVLDSSEKGELRFAMTGKPPVFASSQVIRELLQGFPFWQDHSEDLVYEWIARTQGFVSTDFRSVEGPLLELDSHLTLRSYVVGYTVTPADFAVWGAIRGNKVAYAAVKKGVMLNVSRWFTFVEETHLWIASAVQSLNAHAQERRANKSKEGASYDIALPDTDKGVVTRFPPEPSYVPKRAYEAGQRELIL
ncbi:MAG: hypothetical protein LQ341_003640 [Variospora aurantia]|nr:MAG: hypothetical protein LQ341_003640 [Variospora aurantia]